MDRFWWPSTRAGPRATSGAVLKLRSATEPSWARRAVAALDAILVDHAHCEKKAASMALTLCFRYPDRPALLLPLSRLAREELAHFEEVLAHLAARGVAFGHQPPGPYAAGLLAAVRRDEPARCLDTLLCMALIEARSCERLGLLADVLPDAGLAAFYRGLLAAEARHHATYVELARSVAAPDAVAARLDALAAHEAAVLAATPPLPRLHAG
jgi:tRNA-(ms[2]io[6]A)-hydroxylase